MPQSVTAEGEVMDVELHGAGYVEMGCWNAVVVCLLELVFAFWYLPNETTDQYPKSISSGTIDQAQMCHGNTPNRDFMMPIRDMDDGLDMPDFVLDVATAVWMDFKFGSVDLPAPTPCITLSFFIPSGSPLSGSLSFVNSVTSSLLKLVDHLLQDHLFQLHTYT